MSTQIVNTHPKTTKKHQKPTLPFLNSPCYNTETQKGQKNAQSKNQNFSPLFPNLQSSSEESSSEEEDFALKIQKTVKNQKKVSKKNLPEIPFSLELRCDSKYTKSSKGDFLSTAEEIESPPTVIGVNSPALRRLMNRPKLGRKFRFDLDSLGMKNRKSTIIRKKFDRNSKVWSETPKATNYTINMNGIEELEPRSCKNSRTSLFQKNIGKKFLEDPSNFSEFCSNANIEKNRRF